MFLLWRTPPSLYVIQSIPQSHHQAKQRFEESEAEIVDMSSLSSRRNADNARVHYSVDTYHFGVKISYCGRIVGQHGYRRPCQHCDGNCGPDNGCQCRDCYDLDRETVRRSLLLGTASLFTTGSSTGKEGGGGINEDESMNSPSNTSMGYDGDRERVFFNLCGRRCHVSYNNSPITNTTVSSSNVMGYRFYCGHTLPSDAHTLPRCGPDQGNQCPGCHSLDSLIDTLTNAHGEVRNRDDRLVRIGFDWLHDKNYKRYCGKLVGVQGYASGLEEGQVCLDCDGHCGPTFGCQCRACYELDQVIHLRQQVFHNTLQDIDYSKDYIDSRSSRSLSIPLFPAILNRDGIPVHVSYNAFNDDSHQAKSAEGYRFYCGRIVSSCGGYCNDCIDCDGMCGPGDGCQCIACYQLEQDYVVRSRSCNVNGNNERLMRVKERNEVIERIEGLTSVKECEEMEIRMKEWMDMLAVKKVSVIVSMMHIDKSLSLSLSLSLS